MADVSHLPIPKGKQTQLRNKGLHTTDDLLKLMPLHIYDFSVHTPIRNLRDGDVAAICGVIVHKSTTPKYTKFTIEDESDLIDVFMFGQDWVARKFSEGDKVTVGGKIKKNGYFTNFSSIELFELGKSSKMVTKYSKVKGMSDDYLRKCIKLSQQFPINETIEKDVRQRFRLVGIKRMVQFIHNPQTQKQVNAAKRRLLFEELFTFQLKLFANRRRTVIRNITPFNKHSKVKKLDDSLPFNLTLDQEEVIRVMLKHFKSGDRLNALVQGDVGSGKTMVALYGLAASAENNHQGALMAPTTVLALQHYEEALERLKPLGFNVVFLHGGLKAKEKRDILKQIESGEADVIIGTHAAFSKDVIYNSLKLVIVDEEHRFGVEQREALEDKASEGAHKVSLTATPIPRTLASTMFGDDVESYDIKTMPSGRKEIETVRGDTLYGYDLLEKEIKKGHQGYIVCPLIDENEDINAKDVKSVYKDVKHHFKRTNINVAMVHGQMKQDEIDKVINDFSKGKYHILISTTIIEVGVNVPNTTVMMIESSDRFGLSQLHQLRGRVGRSSYQSYCVLVTDDGITDDAEEKLKVLVGTTDGFEISKADMHLRGAGNLVGIEQTGDSRALDIMISFPKFSNNVKNEVLSILEDPFRLSHYRYMFDELVDD